MIAAQSMRVLLKNAERRDFDCRDVASRKTWLLVALEAARLDHHEWGCRRLAFMTIRSWD